MGWFCDNGDNEKSNFRFLAQVRPHPTHVALCVCVCTSIPGISA